MYILRAWEEGQFFFLNRVYTTLPPPTWLVQADKGYALLFMSMKQLMYEHATDWGSDSEAIIW